ncbi:MAG: transposase, partial [Candidatus Dormibacteraceae bacterium]
RTLLDEVEPEQVAPAYRKLFAKVQRGKVLEQYRFLDNSYLLLADGVEYYRSKNVHCCRCLECHHGNGSVSYYHQMLGLVIAHPDRSEVLPLMPEPIQRQDGGNKGDCERNAAKRAFRRIAKEHPHLRFIVTEDGLSANAPHIELILELGWHYILVAKPKDHTELFAQVAARIEAKQIEPYCYTDPETGVIHCFRWVNRVPLNKSHAHLLVNFLEYWEIGPNLQVWYYNTWVTDFACHKASVWDIKCGGRARWKIENEAFNTLKNQGYHFEHNYGHGEKNLSVIFALLMMLAFMVDQVQQLSNALFQAAWEKCGSKRELWERIRSAFRELLLESVWELYAVVAYGHVRQRPVLQGSEDSS